jgi:nitric oxide reductase subunit B
MPGREWNDKPIAIGFWCLNGGLLAMALISLLPLGLAQAWASLTQGLWYARSDEFLYSDPLTLVRWLRVPGDVIFGLGAVAIGVFMVGLFGGWSLKKDGDEVEAGSLTSVNSAEAPADDTPAADAVDAETSA